MLPLALLFSLAHADVENDNPAPCDGVADGEACTTDAGDTGSCADGECVVPKADDTICGVVGTAALPMVLAALLPALWRRRPA